MLFVNKETTTTYHYYYSVSHTHTVTHHWFLVRVRVSDVKASRSVCSG